MTSSADASWISRIIQGGMGVAVSDWRLARAVSQCGQLGVVSGTGVDTVFVRRLQDGDPGRHLRRAMAAFLAGRSHYSAGDVIDYLMASET